MDFDRRTLLGAVAVAGFAAFAGPAFAAEPTRFTMWRARGCGCCLVWKERMEEVLGLTGVVLDVEDMVAVKKVRGVPADLQSCHTALIDGYVIEGHVPPVDVKRLISSGKRDIVGLAVPGMPAGSPGMDVGHTDKERYEVIAFRKNGKRSVFAVHG